MKTNILTAEINDMTESISRRLKEIAVLNQASMMLAGVDLDCVSSVCVSSYSDSSEIRFYLKEEQRDAKLAAALARKLGVRFEKAKHWDNQSLDVKATVDGITFTVLGYVPTTCNIVEHETPLSDEEYERKCAEAVANVKRVSVRREIVCK